MDLDDSACTTALEYSLIQIDRVVFQERPACVTTLPQSPPADSGTNPYLRYRKYPSGIEEYRIFQTGITNYLRWLAKKDRWVLPTNSEAKDIPIDTVIQMLGAHEVRHRLQETLDMIYTPASALPCLQRLGFQQIPTYCKHWLGDAAAQEFDADVITWMVLGQVLRYERLLTVSELEAIIVSVPLQ